MRECRVCEKKIKFKDRVKYYNYPGIEKICKPCKFEQSGKHNEKKYKAIKDNPLW